MGCLDPLVDIEKGIRGGIGVSAEVGIVEETVKGVAVGIAGTLGNLAGWK